MPREPDSESPSRAERDEVRGRIFRHDDGLGVGPPLVSLATRLAGPTMIALENAGVLGRSSAATPAQALGSMPGHRPMRDAAFQLLAWFGWVEKSGPHLHATPRGLFAFGSSRAWAYGVPVSYLPLLARVDELIFGADPGALFVRDAAGHDSHVPRAPRA